MGVIEFWGGRDQVAALNCQRQGEYCYHNGQHSQRRSQNSLTSTDLWHWLVDHGVPRSEKDRKLS